MMMKSYHTPMALERKVDAMLLRNAIRLVHCLQKERGSSCAFYANNAAFEGAMMTARSASDISATLLRRNDVPVMPTLTKIRNLISTNRNPQESDDPFTLHRIFVCFNTLISYVVHEYILKEISGTDNQMDTKKNRHRRGLSMDINERLKAATTLMPNIEHNSVGLAIESSNGTDAVASYADRKKLATLYSMGDQDDGESGNASRLQSGDPSDVPPHDSGKVLSTSLSDPRSLGKVAFVKGKPRSQQILDLLHLFVQLKESAGVERAILSTLLAFRGSDDPSLQFLVSDLILEVENQRFLVDQLENLPEGIHRDLVLDLTTLSPKLQELQMIILSDFESLIHAHYDFENIWNLITLYVDKLHSVELLLVEELEYSLPVTMSKILSSGALSSLVPQSQPTPVQSLPSEAISNTNNVFPEEKIIIQLSLENIFPTPQNSNLSSRIESLSPEKVKERILQVLREGERKDASENGYGDSYSSNNNHHAAAVSLRHDMARVLDTSTRTSVTTSNAAKEWEISIYELKFTKRIGVGAAATTYLADWSGQEVAVKVASTSRFGLEGWRREVEVLQRLHHPNVIRLLGSVYHETPLTYCLVLEYCNAGDLATILKYPIPKNFFFTAAVGISNAMAYLHSRNVIHRDLKPANVLCDGNVTSGNFTIKVTDFGVATEAVTLTDLGSSTELGETGNLTGETGTYRWMAPEVIRHERYSTLADVYSFATMLWQFLTREDPFLDVSSLDAARLVAVEQQRPPLPPKTPQAVADLIIINWDDNPSKRWPFEKLSTELKQLQSNLTAEELEFLASSVGHPVYEYEEITVKVGDANIDKRDNAKADPKTKRTSLLSSFFGQKRSEKK